MQLDVSDPAHVILQGQIELPSAGRILLRDNIIYAGGLITQYRDVSGRTTGYESYIATVHVSEDLNLLDTIQISQNVIDLALVGDYLFIAQERGLSRLDISNPSQIGDPVRGPRVVDPHRLKVFGNTLLVVSYTELVAFDVSDPQTPDSLWIEENVELGVVHDFAVLNDHIYTVGWQPAGAFIPTRVAIQISESLTEPDYYSTSGTVGIIAAEGLLYRMDQRTVSIEDSSSGALIGSYTALSGGDIAINDDVLYVANRTRELFSGMDQDYVDAYYFPDLSLIGQHAFPQLGEPGTAGLSAITLHEGSLYLFGSLEMRVVSPKTFIQLGRVRSTTQDDLVLLSRPGVSTPVVNSITYLYGSTGEQEYIVRFDVSKPANLVELDRIPLTPDLRVVDIDATEDWLVISLRSTVEAGQDFLALYDLTSEVPLAITEIEVANAPTEVKIEDNTLLATSGDLVNSILAMYSLPDLALLAQIGIPYVHEIEFLSDLVLITMEQDSRLLALDLSNRANPQVVGAFDLPDGAGEIAVSDESTVVGNEEMGLFVLQINQ